MELFEIRTENQYQKLIENKMRCLILVINKNNLCSDKVIKVIKNLAKEGLSIKELDEL